MQLFGSWPNLTPLAPFYSFVVVFNNNNTIGRFNSLSLLSRYIGPARQHGTGSIRVQIDRTVHVVRTCRFIAAPGAEVDPTTLRVTPTHTSGSTKTTPQRELSGIDDADSSITTPTKIETQDVRPVPAREQICAAAGRTDAAAEPPGNPGDDEPRCSWYISRPWAIPNEFWPRNAT